MADALLGEHLELQCADCGITIRCGAEYLADERHVVCPNCGFAGNVLQGNERRRGDRVWIDRSARARSPQRWDAVALISADDPDRLEVKRVVGLPGEWVELKNGDVWVNGRPAAKTISQFRQLAIRVHDDRFRPADPQLPHRWRDAAPATANLSAGNLSAGNLSAGNLSAGNLSDGNLSNGNERHGLGDTSKPAASIWQPTMDGYRHVPATHASAQQLATTGRWQWLAYQQWPCMPNPFPPRNRTQSGNVLDHYGYNQARSRGTLNAVEDLRLSFRLLPCSAGQLGLRLRAAGHLYEVHWSPATRRVRLLQDGSEVRSVPAPVVHRSVPALVEWAHWDSQVALAVDGRLIVLYREAVNGKGGMHSDRAGGDRPTVELQIGTTADAVVEIDQLMVDRDLVYLNRLGMPQAWSPARRLGAGEYLVLGDNVPLSRDSRHWRSPFLPRRAILGTVLGPRLRVDKTEKTISSGY